MNEIWKKRLFEPQRSNAEKMLAGLVASARYNKEAARRVDDVLIRLRESRIRRFDSSLCSLLGEVVHVLQLYGPDLTGDRVNAHAAKTEQREGNGGAGAREVETRQKTSVPEVDTILRELAEKGAIMTGRAARSAAWAEAIRSVSGKTCSRSTVTATTFWTERGNPRGKRGPAPMAVGLTEALAAAVPVADNVLRKLIDEVEEKVVQDVMDSRLSDPEKAGLVKKLRDGEMTAAQASETLRLAAEQHGEREPSPLDPDPPDRPRRVKQHRSV